MSYEHSHYPVLDQSTSNTREWIGDVSDYWIGDSTVPYCYLCGNKKDLYVFREPAIYFCKKCILKVMQMGLRILFGVDG